MLFSERTTQPVPAPAHGHSPTAAAVLAQLERILCSGPFQHSKRYPAFLRHVVEQTLHGAGDQLKERTIGVTVFKRVPDYDTAAEPVVRNTATEVRKRLEEYYSWPAHEQELRITLPVGAYTPEFAYPLASSPVIPDAILPAASGPVARRRTLVAATAVLAAVALVGTIAVRSRKSAADRFWEPILQPSERVLIVTDTLVAPRNPQPDSGGSTSQVTPVFDPKVFLQITESTAKLAAFLGGHGKQFEFELARSLTIAGLRRRPFILLGAFNNSLTRPAVEPFRFYLQLDRNTLVRRILDHENPSRQEWTSPMTSELTEDYALIARAPNPDTGQMMLVIAGLGERATVAAREYVTNPKYLESFAAQAPAGWERRNIELVIRTKLVNGEWGEPRLVATHFW